MLKERFDHLIEEGFDEVCRDIHDDSPRLALPHSRQVRSHVCVLQQLHLQQQEVEGTGCSNNSCRRVQGVPIIVSPLTVTVCPLCCREATTPLVSRLPEWWLTRATAASPPCTNQSSVLL